MSRVATGNRLGTEMGLRSAVEMRELEAMPDVPPLPRQSKKLPDAPGDEEVASLGARSRSRQTRAWVGPGPCQDAFPCVK